MVGNMNNHTITEEIKQNGRTYKIKIDFIIIGAKGNETMDIQEIEFYPLPDVLRCPNCDIACNQHDMINDTSMYAHKQYYLCEKCGMLFTEDDTIPGGCVD